MLDNLNKSHYKIWERNPEISQSKEHTKKSTEFAINLLKIVRKECFDKRKEYSGFLEGYDYGYCNCLEDMIIGLNDTISKLEEKLWQ